MKKSFITSGLGVDLGSSSLKAAYTDAQDYEIKRLQKN